MIEKYINKLIIYKRMTQINIKKTIADLEDRKGTAVLLDNLFEELHKQKISKTQVQEAMDKLEEEGYLIELKEGCYQRKRKFLGVEKEKYLSDLKFLFQAIKKDKKDLISQFVPNYIENIKRSVTDFLNNQFVKDKISEEEFENMMGWIPDPYLQSARIDFRHEKRKKGLKRNV